MFLGISERLQLQDGFLYMRRVALSTSGTRDPEQNAPEVIQSRVVVF